MRTAFILLLAPVLALLNGCAGYHIGPVAPKHMDGVRTVAVPTFRNESLEPRLEVLVTNIVIKQIQQDGTYQVTDSERADVVVEGKIEKVRRRSSRSVRGDIQATREFVVMLDLSYKVKRRSTGEVLNIGRVVGDTSFFVGSDVQQEERQALPLAAEDAAVRMVSELTEGW